MRICARTSGGSGSVAAWNTLAGISVRLRPGQMSPVSALVASTTSGAVTEPSALWTRRPAATFSSRRPWEFSKTLTPSQETVAPNAFYSS